jgi:diguanylate cyclase (GGDEF)-like protein/PAS domain S-box-containing protein
MNILPFLHFSTFLVYFFLLVFLLWKDPKSLLNRVCAALLACFVVWSFTSIFIYNPSASKDTVRLFDNLGSLGWISFSSFFLWFALVFTEKNKILKTRMIYSLIFIPPLLFIYTQWAGFLTVDYIQRHWGWESVLSDSIWTYLFFLYSLLFLAIGLYLILNFGRKTEEPIKKKQARIIFIAALISVTISTLTDIILPILDIHILPSLANVFALIWVSGIVYAIAKYKLMVITPVAAAENIISTMADSLILLDRQGNIASANKATLDLSGYGEDELIGKPVEVFFVEKGFKSTLLDKAIKKEIIRNYELGFKTKIKDIIPILFSSSTIMDKAGGIAGIVCIIKDITERKQVEEAIKKSQQEFASLFHSSPEALVYFDENTNILNVNPCFTQLFGYSLKEIKGRNLDDGMIHPSDKLEEGKKLTIKGLKGYINYETIRKKKDNTLFPVSISAMPLVIDGQIKGVIGIYMDISQRIKLQNALQESEERLSFILDATNDGIWDRNFESGKLYLNDNYYRMLGYHPSEITITQKVFEGLLHPEDKERVLRKIKECIEGKTERYSEEVRLKTKSGQWKWILGRGSVVSRDSNGKALRFVGTHTDISRRKETEEKLEKLARFDSLTGCYNRGYGLELLDRQMKLSHRSKSPLLLAFLDIDKFKLINDTFGHDEGDQVLKEVTNLFKSTLREIDIICRMGGDEFLLIFPDNSLKDAVQIKERLNKNLIELNQNLKKPYQIDFSMGLSEYDPDKSLSMDELIRIADQKMYKEKGRKNKGRL